MELFKMLIPKKNLTKICLIFYSFLFFSCKQEDVPTNDVSDILVGCNSQYYSNDFLGEYKICQPNGDDKRLKIELKNPQIEKKYCFIPNYHNNRSKKAIYIGEPRCLFIKYSDKAVDVTFLKNRRSPDNGNDYSKLPINAVMILVDEVHNFPPPYEFPISSVEAYLKCLEFIDSLEDKSYCEAFKEMKLYTFHLFQG